MGLNKEIAARIADEHMTKWMQRATYTELAGMETDGESELRRVLAEDGLTYSVKFHVLPDGDGALRLAVEVDDGGWSAFRPLSRHEIMRPDGSYVE